MAKRREGRRGAATVAKELSAVVLVHLLKEANGVAHEVD